MDPDLVDDVVVGSGPTAWAACMGVWARGGKPVVVDAGYTASDFGSESVVQNAQIKSKSQFGSEHMYTFPCRSLGIVPPQGVIPLSGALGGLSTVWGAGIQPVSTVDLSGVPDYLSRDWLNASEQLLREIDFLGRDDLLSLRDPWPVSPQDEVVMSARFKKVLQRAEKLSEKKFLDTVYGSPRLAIKGSKDRNRSGACVICGDCMVGCPEGSIFDSGREILKRIEDVGGEYLQGVVTQIISDKSNELDQKGVVTLLVEDRNGKTRRINARRLYLAAGAIGSPTLLQRSALAPQHLEVKDSQMFYGAFISVDSRNAAEEIMTTSQGYFSTTKAVSLRDEFSMSVYEYSTDFQARLEQFVPVPLRPLIQLAKPVMKNIFPGIGFLSQDVSGSIHLDYDGNETKVTLVNNTETSKAIQNAMRRIARTSRQLGLFRLPNPFKAPNVGAGFHAGASMPMGDKLHNLVDWKGRLRSEPRIHIVDASSLMRIKAGSHTFMAMANAYRIAVNPSGE